MYHLFQKGISQIREYGILSFIRKTKRYFFPHKTSYDKVLPEFKNYNEYKCGSYEWLVAAELQFGGLVRGVKIGTRSELDPRTDVDLINDSMIGGDRMFFNNYGKKYAKHLLPFVKRRSEELVIVEVGILKGNGLAIWSELFPKSNVYGFDIDLSHVNGNMNNLLNRGAFKNKNLYLFEFDQFKDNAEYVKEILKGKKIDVVIDDGFHSNESIIKTLESLMPSLSNKFVYFIEDNFEVYDLVKNKISNSRTYNYNNLTVIENC